MRHILLRERFPEPPAGRSKLRWYGPGLLWMLSAVGTGSILFTPRVASAYQYELLWLLLLVVFFMWVMIREMARFSIVTGQTMLEGMYTLRGPRGWAVWLIFLPQLLAAAVGIAGLSAVVGSAVQSFVPGSATLYGILLVILCTLFVSSGRYMKIERLSRMMAILLMAMVVVSAVVVAPNPSDVAKGLAISWPDSPDLYVILPWVGTILAGSMGIVWFGYWTATRGYGGGLTSPDQDDEKPEDARRDEASLETDEESRTRAEGRAKAWVGTVTGAATLGVLGGLVVIFSFLILGAELLAPAGVMPEGTDVAVDLARLFSDVWGSAGKYLLLLAIIVALGGSVLANQDGWGRSFADMALILLRPWRSAPNDHWLTRAVARVERATHLPVLKRTYLKRIFVVSITGVVPVGIILLFKNPVAVMSASGIIASIHTPFIALTALYVNRTRLPKPLRPGLFITFAMAAAGLFYLSFAIVYLWDFLFGS